MASGSQRRRRRHAVRTTFDDAEYAAFLERCERAGLSASSCLRAAALSYPLPRAVRRPNASHKELARLTGELGAIAGTLRAIRDDVSARTDATALEAALTELSVLTVAVLETLGRRP